MKKHHDGLIALSLFATLFSVYLLTFSGTYHSSDEMSMLAVTDSLARRGAWDTELLHWMGEQQGVVGRDGFLYSGKSIGLKLLALPHYWLALQSSTFGNVQVAMLTNGLVTALTAVIIYLYLRLLAYGRGASLGTALAFGLATMAWPYARYFFSEPLAGLGLILSAYFLLRYRLSSDLTCGSSEVGQNRRGEWLYPFLAGAGLGIALLSRLNTAIVTPVLGLVLVAYLYRCHGRHWRAWIKPLLFFVLAVAVALLASAWYNWIRFGGPLVTGYLREDSFSAPFLEGFYGSIFSPGKGLFWYNPILLAALLAWPAFYRRGGGRQRVEALLVVAVVLCNIAFYAPWYLWWAGHGWGPRFLVTLLPFAILPVASAFEAASRRRLFAAALILLLIVSVAVQLVGVAVDFNLYLEDIYASLGLYHPDTLFKLNLTPLLRQTTYIQLENLDIAWVRDGTIDAVPLLVGLFLATASVLALWAAVRQRLNAWLAVGLLVLLALGTMLSMRFYAPSGDMATLARTLTAMELPNEMAALVGSDLTGDFQDAYDGRLRIWGLVSEEGWDRDIERVWVIGAGGDRPAEAHFQAGELRMDLHLPAGERLENARLPIPLWNREARVEDLAYLAAAEIGKTEIRPGGTLPLALFWRALGSSETSYTTYVQLIEEKGAKAGQVDQLPCDGSCLTTTWRPGDLIGEFYSVAIPADAPPGSYRVIAGMYDFATGENLSWFDAKGSVMGPNLVLGLVEVLP